MGRRKAAEDEFARRLRGLNEEQEQHSALFIDPEAVVVEAGRAEETDPDKADAIYAAGIEHFPNSAPLLRSYAFFLCYVRRDYNKAEDYYKKAIEADPNYDKGLGHYALFLHFTRKDHGKAEEYYKRAIEARPHANYLGNYAALLSNSSRDYGRAEDYYKKALELDPNHTNNLTNGAGSLLACGKTDEGTSLLNRALILLTPDTSPSLVAECWFYALAHLPPERRPEAISRLKRALTEGARSPGWDLSPNVERARADGHPHAGWLGKLASVISDGADISILDAWPEWREAATPEAVSESSKGQ